MSDIGGIGKQVFKELKGVVKKTVEETTKAGVDIVKGTIETVVGGTDPVTQPSKKQVENKAVEHGDTGKTMKQQQVAAKEQKGLQRVRGELADFIRAKKQGETQQEQVEERQAEIKKEQKEQTRESDRDAIIRRAQRSGGGTRELFNKKQ